MWTIIYIIAFFASAVIGGPLLTKILTGDGKLFAVKWDDSVGKIHTDYTYGTGEYHKFDLYVPADNMKKTYGLVVYIHGGGFSDGDKKDDQAMLKYYTSKGYVAAGINYTLNTKEKACSLYQMSLEIQQGVAAVYEKARELGYHLDQMAISGGSAGSLLAMVYAYRDYKTSPIPVKCCIQACGPTYADPIELGYCKDYISNESADAAVKLVSSWTGDLITVDMIRSGEYKKNIIKVSPSLLVDENTVPTLLAHGHCDKIVAFRQAQRLVEAFEKHKVAYDFIEFPKSGHRLNWEPKLMELYKIKLDSYLDTYLPNR